MGLTRPMEIPDIFLRESHGNGKYSSVGIGKNMRMAWWEQEGMKTIFSHFSSRVILYVVLDRKK